jgi:hypothetical protein
MKKIKWIELKKKKTEKNYAKLEKPIQTSLNLFFF